VTSPDLAAPPRAAGAQAAPASRPHRGRPLGVRLLALLGGLLPGDRLKTWVYLNLIARPRDLAAELLTGFYRIDVIYEVLRRARRCYGGEFSILEFGTAHGYAFTKMLYATRFLGMEDRVRVHAFDTFEGMPASSDPRDRDHVTGEGWLPGQFASPYEELEAYCRGKYRNYGIHRGLFEDALTPELLESLRRWKPLLVWIDCDFYSSTRTAMERLLPLLPNGCVVYFDDHELLNYGSRFTGEARFVHELNRGDFGEGLELVLDRRLSRNLARCYRFVRVGSEVQYPWLRGGRAGDAVRRRTNDSALP
jgi:hypothetical protein